MADLLTKLAEYLASGTQRGFLPDVAAGTAYVYRPGQPVEAGQGYEQELSGEPVLLARPTAAEADI